MTEESISWFATSVELDLLIDAGIEQAERDNEDAEFERDLWERGES